jgi:hypothetical protein
MNYLKIYNMLIEKRKMLGNPEGYGERHHILPKAFGGTDEENNLIILTAREHFIAHLLLSKIYGGKMIYALYMMSTRDGYTNRRYEKARLEFSQMVSENKDRAEKIRNKVTGKPKSEEHRKNWFESRKNGAGWIVTDEHKEKISKSLSGDGNPMFGKTHTDEARRLISEANERIVVCPHCGKQGGVAIMPRWHFDRCKENPTNRGR